MDVNNGRVVKGVNFVNLIDAGDPVSVGAAYGEAGADELVFLILRHPVMQERLRQNGKKSGGNGVHTIYRWWRYSNYR